MSNRPIDPRLGVYRALADGGPQTPRELAERTGLGERRLREWLSEQAARGHINYDPCAQTFSLAPEQDACLADLGYAGAASRPATSASCRSDIPTTARWPSRSSA